MLGIDLVLPDFAYLRERADDIEGIVITHGHEDHLGALPFVLRELKALDIPVFGGPLTIAMARSKLDEHKLQEVEVVDVQPRRAHRGRPVRHRAHPHDALDPGRLRGRRDLRPRDGPLHGRLQVRPDAGRRPARRREPPRRARARPACSCCAATPRTPTAPATRRARRTSGPQLYARVRALRGPHRRHVASPPTSTACSRSSTPRSRSGARSASSGARCARTSTSARSLGHIAVPEGLLIAPRELDDFPDDKLVVISTGSQGEPLSALRRMAHRDHPAVELREGDTVVFSATPIPGNERAVNETIDRLYHIGCNVITTARRRRSTPPATATRRRSSSC